MVVVNEPKQGIQMTESDETNQAFAEGFYGLPTTDELASQTVLELAERLATEKEGSPAFIVVQHALNMKIAKSQSKATL